MIDSKDISDSTLRLIAWKGLETYSTAELLDLLSDRDPVVRTLAAKRLHLGGDKQALLRAQSLCKSNSWRDREIGTFLLGQLGTPLMPYKRESVPVLLQLLDDRSSMVRAGAAAALGHLHSEEAIPALVRAASDRISRVRVCVAFALSKFQRDPRVKVALSQLRRDDDKDVRDWADL